MSEHNDDLMRVIRVWAAMAWADGVIASAESAAIKKVVELADLDEEQAGTALGWLEERVELSTEGLEDLQPSAKEGIYKAAIRLANVDLDVATEELTLLERLRQALDIDSERASELEAELS
jgi:uncharacterized membrane protein YebE (DUF533 family)